MHRKQTLNGIVILFFLLWASSAFAADVKELERRINSLSEEVDQMKAKGPAGGSEVERIKIHGYGEMHYNSTDQGPSTMDNHRFVIGVHALLTDWIHLNAEVDYEHGAQELEFELGYLDFLLNDKVNARAGVMLLPIGSLNEFHEPPLFWTVERPEFHSKIIPSTWNAGGFGFFGTPVEGLNYRLYLTNSIQSIRPDTTSDGSGAGNGNGGFSGRITAQNGIRDARKQVNQVAAQDLAVSGRLEYSKLYPGLNLGFSFYTGDTTQGYIDEGGRVTLIEADMKYRQNWFDMNASFANISVGDAQALNTFCASHSGCNAEIAENMMGLNVQVGAHLPQLMGINTSHDLVSFFMYEKIRPQDEMPSGTAPTRSRNFDVFSGGLTYYPISSVALKADYQHLTFDDNTSESKVNMGVAYMF